MPQSLEQIYLHIVYSTKDRRPFLQEESLRENLHAWWVRRSTIAASRFRMNCVGC